MSLKQNRVAALRVACEPLEGPKWNKASGIVEEVDTQGTPDQEKELLGLKGVRGWEAFALMCCCAVS